MSEDELLESAWPRNFVVAVQGKFWPKNDTISPRVLVISAHSIKEAKHKTFRKVAQGKYKYIRFSNLKFTSIEDAGRTEDEPSDSQGT